MNTTTAYATIYEWFADCPVSIAICRYWENQNSMLLDAAVAKLVAHGANPWVFSADARHFWQFASIEDYNALISLTPEEHNALLGVWSDEEWSPDRFGYDYPR